MAHHPAALAVCALTLATLATGCTLPGGTKSPGPATASTAGLPTSVTTVATPSASAFEPSSSASPGPSVATESPTASAGPIPTLPTATLGAPAPTPTAVGGATIVVPAGSTRPLTLVDAAASTGWVQGPAQPVGATGWIYAVSSTVGCQATSAPLEFRFAATSGVLQLGLEQAADSRSSAERLEFAVVIDGRAAATRAVAYGERADLTVPLSGASRVQLTLSNPSPCQGTATGLITRAVVTG